MSYHNYNPFALPPRPQWSSNEFLIRYRSKELEKAMFGQQIEHHGPGSSEDHRQSLSYADIMNACAELVPELYQLILEGMTQTGAPAEVLSLSLICAGTAAGQGAYDVTTPKGRAGPRVGPMGVYGFGSGPSGTGKSSGGRFAFAPFYEFESEQDVKMAELRILQKAKYVTWEVKAQALKGRVKDLVKRGQDSSEADAVLEEHSKQEPLMPRAFRHIYSRVSSATMRDAMHMSPSVLLATMESDSFFNGYGLRDLPIFNEAWDGDPLGPAGHERISRPRVTICGWGQQLVVPRFVARRGVDARDMGSFARMLFVDIKGDGYRAAPPSHATAATEAFRARIKDLLNMTHEVGMGLKPQVIGLSSSAASLWAKFESDIKLLENPGGRFVDAKDLSAKLLVNALRISAGINLLVFGDGPIEEPVFRFACIYANSCADQFLYMFSKKNSGAALTEALVKSIINLRDNHKMNRITRSDLMQRGDESIRNCAALNKAMGGLGEEYYRYYHTNSRGGFFLFT